jgi:hypothetical protein
MCVVRDRHHAAVGDITDSVLELDGCVMDVEAFSEATLHVSQNRLAL